MNNYQPAELLKEPDSRYAKRTFAEWADFDGGTAIYVRGERLTVSLDNPNATPIEEIRPVTQKVSMETLKLRLIAFRLIENVPSEILPEVVNELRESIEYEQRMLEERSRQVRYIASETKMLPILS